MQRLIYICFYIPFIFKALNIQGFLTIFTPAPEIAIQLFAYFTLSLVVIGTFSLYPKWNSFPFLNRLWIVFYLAYFPISILANIFQDTEPHRLLVALIPVVFFISFSVLFGDSKERERFTKISTIVFFIVSLLTIVFNYYNISMDFEGVYEFRLERAGGIYGDANNAALASQVGFVLIFYTFKPYSLFGQIIRYFALFITLYATIITFSKTGFLVLLLISIMAVSQKLSFEKIIIVLLMVPFISFLGYQYAVEAEILSKTQIERIEDIINLVTLNTANIDYSSRDVLLQNMLNFIYENPILGNGVQFSNLIRGHNTIIGIWADAGIFVFLIFIALLLTHFKMALATKGSNRLLVISLLLILTVYMLTLQTVINQAYLIVLFAYLGYITVDPLTILK